jgi:hypothetical protein
LGYTPPLDADHKDEAQRVQLEAHLHQGDSTWSVRRGRPVRFVPTTVRGTRASAASGVERENASEGIRRFFTWIVGIALVIAAVIFLLPAISAFENARLVWQLVIIAAVDRCCDWTCRTVFTRVKNFSPLGQMVVAHPHVLN